MRTPASELQALAALRGGTSEAAELLGVDEDILQAAIDGDSLPRGAGGQIDKGFTDLTEDDAELAATIERVKEIFEVDPEAAELLTNSKEFAAAFVEHNELEAFLFEASPVVLRTISDYAGQGNSLERMLTALENDVWSLENKESQFWDWFREIYDE